VERFLNFLRYAAAVEVIAGGLRLWVAALKLGFPKLECDRVQLDDLIGKLFLLFRSLLALDELFVVDRFRQLNARDLGHTLDRLGEVQPLHLHQKRISVPALAAPETLVKTLRRRHRERRCLLLMERAAPHPIGSLLLQLSIRLNYPHQIGPVAKIVNEVLFVEHRLRKIPIFYDILVMVGRHLERPDKCS
jgi:hypothetical protein